MEQSIKFNLKAKEGTPISQEIQHTIHQIGPGVTIGQRDGHPGKTLDNGAGPDGKDTFRQSRS